MKLNELNLKLPQWQEDLQQHYGAEDNFINIQYEPKSNLCYRTYNSTSTDIMPIVAIHGWTLNSLTFHKVAQQLKDNNNNFFALDMHGCGMTAYIKKQNDSTQECYSWDMQSNSVKIWADNVLGKDKPYILLGQDSGAIIARYVGARDELVKAIAMVNTEAAKHRPPRTQLYRISLFLPYSEPAFKFTLGQDAFINSILGFKSYFHNINNLKNPEFQLRIIQPLLDTIDGQAAFIKGWDFSELDKIDGIHQQITVPLAMIWGTDDKNFPLKNAQSIRDNTKTDNSNIKIVEVKGCGAFVQEEKPEILAQEILELLNKV